MRTKMKLHSKILLYVFLAVVSIITVIPLLYTFSASFKTNLEIAGGGIDLIPNRLRGLFEGKNSIQDLFANYIKVWSMSGSTYTTKATYLDYTLNSVLVSLLTVFLVVLFTSMSAYAFQRGRFPGKQFLYWLFLGTMFVGAGSITIFPMLKITTSLNINNRIGLAIVQFGTAGATNLFLTMGYLKTISTELDQAARIDGCSFFSTWWRIILPLSKPILGTIALMTFRASWNNYLVPNLMLTKDPAATTLVVAVVRLQSAGGAGSTQYNLMMTGTMFAMLPMLILFIAMNRTFVEGVTAGSVKG